MDFRFTEEQEKLRQEMREFFQRELAPEKTAGQDDPLQPGGYKLEFWKAFQKKMGEAGFLARYVSPKYGGLGRPHIDHALVQYEHAYANAPGGDLAWVLLGQPIGLFGSEDQKSFYLPKIVNGEVVFCVGYSEPSAGSDLASLRCQAVADGDDFVINGQKIFTTNGHFADFCWLLARTDPSAPKHKGLSLFILDMKTPGITVRPLWTMAGWRHNEVFFDNVRIPKSTLVGELNRGWYQVAAALDFERSFFGAYGSANRLLDEMVDFCKNTQRNGRPMSKDPLIRQQLAQFRIDIDTGFRFSLKVAWMQSAELVPNYEASMNKIWASELIQRMVRWSIQALGLYGPLMKGSKYAVADGMFAFELLDCIPGSIAGGTNEIQRNIVAQRGLGLPRG